MVIFLKIFLYKKFNIFSPEAKVKQLVKQALPFKFVQNKIAIVEKENETDYIAIQYLIENDWNLVVTTKDQEDGKTWELKQKIGGQLRDLFGTRKVYYDRHAKNPKCSKSQFWKLLQSNKAFWSM